jgi:prefoldin subunit 5
MGARDAAGSALRRLAPRTFTALEKVGVLEAELHGLRGAVTELRAHVDLLGARAEEVAQSAAGIRTDLEESRRRAGVADDALARLHDRVDHLDESVADLGDGLTESRRLSRRVGQMTDLVFDRLVAEEPVPELPDSR